MRTIDGKGLTIPSQIRYTYYFEENLKCNSNMPIRTMYLKKIRLNSFIPTDKEYKIKIKKGVDMDTIYTSSKADSTTYIKYLCLEIVFTKIVPLSADFKIEFYEGIATIFRCWLHTSFIPDSGLVVIHKHMLDRVCKDKTNTKTLKNFTVEFEFCNCSNDANVKEIMQMIPVIYKKLPIY